jgi:hypothetical protein
MNPATTPAPLAPSISGIATANGHTLGRVTAQVTGQVTTTTFPLTPPEPAESAVGGLVFFVVVAIIVAGAVLLYLRNRAPRGSDGRSGRA